jgi:YHS domain-containing protein
MTLKQKILSVTDPVCGVELDYHDARFTCKVGDDAYHFCSEACRNLFEKDPEKFIDYVQLREWDEQGYH